MHNRVIKVEPNKFWQSQYISILAVYFCYTSVVKSNSVKVVHQLHLTSGRLRFPLIKY